VGIFRLATGNVTGKVLSGTTPVANAAVTAVRTDDNSKIVTTVTRKDGTYELNLNVEFNWVIKAIDPETLKKGEVAVTATTPSNAVIADKNISIT